MLFRSLMKRNQSPHQKRRCSFSIPQLNKLVLTHSNLSVCLSTASYPDTADYYSFYHALLNALLWLIQVSLSNSPFTLKSACFEYVPILGPIVPRSTHDCFSWIDNFNPVSL